MVWAQEQRKKIINQIRARFIIAAKKDRGLNRDKLIADIIINFGSTSRKALEYINDLKAEGYITEDELGLWLNKEFVPELEIKQEDVDKILEQTINAE